MKTLELAETNLEQCVKAAGGQSIIVVKNGRPVALVSDVKGLDAEQIELGTSAEFWKLIEERRQQKSVPWETVKKRLGKLKH